MPLFALDKKLWFPPVADACDDGLLAIGGDLSAERLLLAYHRGIFPWFDGDVPLWWSPDPRFVLFPENLKVSKSMKSMLARQPFTFSINKAFSEVINACKKVDRKDQYGTWITDEMREAYLTLHKLGYAHSAEVWSADTLIGGLYGVKINNVFCGESMFSLASNASKYAFILFVKHLVTTGTRLIDCQVYTSHLESLGAEMISREVFLSYLEGT
ncbi:leucyl/phenylalanyl-tRNA--protein transferase [Segetibacter sp. 3557_3]|uniref:leucyl/phenylalanyl-tRNA--protein transferase n=1 Tax=Segetibacter sp. 3557_3 TaxID=2547429 RepID=UPI001058BCD5|nr:leucyl/phenylalanyl-tRNA--protein transferase [Segetibacter sp. 3557_3]TDH28998.1 leucyl/phenylalanyl-tRNA--protein transferase [Segetibacter sp. 3557_3]